MRVRLVDVGLFALSLSACSHGSRVEPGEPHAGGHEQGPLDAGSPAATAPNVPGATQPPATTTPAAQPTKVKISIRSAPKADVRWGRKSLGVTPVTIERPRDSGPIDLVLRSSGYFPVHTRVYTVKNDNVSVHLTRLKDRMTLFGAKAELPPDAPDGGTPPPGAVVDPGAPKTAPIAPPSFP
jgi:hypothetical protein